MDQDKELESFRKGLRKMAAEEAETPDLDGLPPLSPQLENKLLQISLAARPSKESAFERMRGWWREPARPLLAISAALVPIAALLLYYSLWWTKPAATAIAIDRYALRAGSSAAPQGANGQAILHAAPGTTAAATQLRAPRNHNLTLVLYPPQPQKGQVAIRAFILRRGQVTDWKVSFELADDSSFRLFMPIRELPDLESDQELLFAVGRPDALPTKEGLAAGQQPDNRTWSLERLRLTLD